MPPARARLQSAALHKLGLGTAQFGGQFGPDCGAPAGKGRMSEAEAMAAVALAADAGVRLIDTSAQYGDSEAVLGRVVPKAPPSPPPFRIVTKTAPVTVGVNLVETAARASLVRLGVTKAAAIVVHTAADLLGPDGPELWTRLNRLKDEGLYEAVGISARAADDPVGLARRFKPDVMQIPVSLLDQRLIADGALSTLAELGVEVHLRSVFQQGAAVPAALGPASQSGGGGAAPVPHPAHDRRGGGRPAACRAGLRPEPARSLLGHRRRRLSGGAARRPRRRRRRTAGAGLGRPKAGPPGSARSQDVGGGVGAIIRPIPQTDLANIREGWFVAFS